MRQRKRGTLAEQDVSNHLQTPFEIAGISMKYRCQSCNYELPDIWKWKIVDRSKYLMVVTCPHCNNEFIRMEYDPNTPYGYKVVSSMIFIPQGVRNRVKGNR